jgi:hypothetical protein
MEQMIQFSFNHTPAILDPCRPQAERPADAETDLSEFAPPPAP